MPKHNKLIELLIPKIFQLKFTKYFIKLYYYRIIHGLFLKKKYKKKFNYEWSQIELNRIALVNFFLHKSLLRKPDTKYLEIGCANNKLWSSVIVKPENKIGVDPEKGGNLRLTSDEFFKTNNSKFDVVFIDGLHTYEQCQKDTINSINCLNDDGVILFHDFLPINWESEHVPRFVEGWTGDVWKVAYELSISSGGMFKIIECDSGVGIFFKKKDFKYQKLNYEIKDKDFKYFCEIYPKLPIMDPKEFIKDFF